MLENCAVISFLADLSTFFSALILPGSGSQLCIFGEVALHVRKSSSLSSSSEEEYELDEVFSGELLRECVDLDDIGDEDCFLCPTGWSSNREDESEFALDSNISGGTGKVGEVGDLKPSWLLLGLLKVGFDVELKKREYFGR